MRKKKFAQTKIKISNCYQDHWKFQLIKTLMNIKREREREREAQQKLLVFHPLLDLVRDKGDGLGIGIPLNWPFYFAVFPLFSNFNEIFLFSHK